MGRIQVHMNQLNSFNMKDSQIFNGMLQNIKIVAIYLLNLQLHV